jgi:hypothetical protein
VLIAELDDAHRTEIALDYVEIWDINPLQVHLAFADTTTIAHGVNSATRQRTWTWRRQRTLRWSREEIQKPLWTVPIRVRRGLYRCSEE